MYFGIYNVPTASIKRYLNFQSIMNVTYDVQFNNMTINNILSASLITIMIKRNHSTYI